MKIVLLSDYPELIPNLAQQWYEELGKLWVPSATVKSAEERFNKHLNSQQLPLAYVMLNEQNLPIGMICLRINEGIRTELIPWLGGLFVNVNYRSCGFGEQLIEKVKQQARMMGYKKLYLLTFNPTLPHWYAQLGWNFFDKDTFMEKPITIMETDLIR